MPKAGHAGLYADSRPCWIVSLPRGDSDMQVGHVSQIRIIIIIIIIIFLKQDYKVQLANNKIQMAFFNKLTSSWITFKSSP